VDLSECSKIGLERAALLAERSGAKLEIVHAYHAPPDLASTLTAWMPDNPADAAAFAEQRAAGKLEMFLSTVLRARESRTKIHLVNAEAHSAILGLAEQSRPDLLVLGRHGGSGWSRWLLGSVALKVVREAPCPVLTVPHRPQADGGSAPSADFARVLVAVDFSEGSKAALAIAAKLAQIHGGTLDVVHTWDIAPVLAPDVTLGSDVLTPAVASAASGEAGVALSEFVRQASEAGFRIERAHLERGPAARMVVDLAERGEYDLVAIGTHGRSGIMRLLVGSVAEQILRRSTRPVLSVRAG
jgi:nucleotide-binding universal stress UspA family protein